MAEIIDDIVAQIQSAISSSRNGYLQPVDVISTGDELRFTVAESNVSQFVALETLDLSGFDGQRKAEQLILNSLGQIHGERSSIGAQKNRLFQSSLSIMDISGAMENARSLRQAADSEHAAGAKAVHDAEKVRQKKLEEPKLENAFFHTTARLQQDKDAEMIEFDQRGAVKREHVLQQQAQDDPRAGGRKPAIPRWQGPAGDRRQRRR